MTVVMTCHLRRFPLNRVGHLCHHFSDDNRGSNAEVEISACIGICSSVSGLLRHALKVGDIAIRSMFVHLYALLDRHLVG